MNWGESTEHYLLLCTSLFLIGAIGFVVRRNLLVQLLSIILMLNAALLLSVSFVQSRPAAGEGELLPYVAAALMAMQLVMGFRIVLQFFRSRGSIDGDAASSLRR